MADGDVIVASPGRLVVVLMDAVAATGTTNGVWVDCREYDMGTITIIGATGAAIIEVDGLNDMRASTTTAPPANTNQGVRVTSAALAAGQDAFIPLAALPNWIKARVQTLGTGTVTAVLCARSSAS